MTAPNGLEMQHDVPSEVITSPTTMDEAYVGSLKAMLARNKGNYIVATFLIGTQGTVSWEGVLFDVGNDYVTIYQEPRDRYIVCDIYSLKYMEFYDTRRRELCNRAAAPGGTRTAGDPKTRRLPLQSPRCAFMNGGTQRLQRPR